MKSVFEKIQDPYAPPVIVAEVSANHNRSIEKAKEIILAAADSGADAIKLQTYTADTITIDAPQDDFKIIDPNSLWNGRRLYDLYQEAHTPWEWHEELFRFARECNLDIFSTPFDNSAVDFLMSFNPSCFKIASFELTHDPLLRKVAQTKKPVILSSGMSTIEELNHAINILNKNGCQDLIILKCTSAYPAPTEEMNLRGISTISKNLNVFVGLSDHTLDHTATIVAISLGARLIEKHLTIKRSEGGPDADFSIEPTELAELVKISKKAWASLGDGILLPSAREQSSKAFRQSIYIVKNVTTGELVTPKCIQIVRPGFGMEPKYYDQILGKRFRSEQSRGTALKPEEMIF